MESQALANFLQAIVQKHRRDRYAGYLGSEKGRRKLLAALDHDSERDIEPRKVAKSLSEKEWSQPALLLSSSGIFGREYSSVRGAYDEAPWEGGWLVVGGTGEFGVYRPEGKSDGEVVIRAGPTWLDSNWTQISASS
ncbi:MAG: hypothetical protein ACWA44_01710, partial [Thiotrichales bacterium]